MYYWLFAFMVSSPASLYVASPDILPVQADARSTSEVQSCFGLGFLMAFLSLTLVTIVVPERPNQLASICQQQNSTIACRVW